MIAKKTAFKPADPPLMAADPKNVATAVALKELYCAPKREIDPESGEPIEPTEELLNEFESEDIVGDATMYQAVGLGLSLSEMYGVMLAVKRLGEEPKRNCGSVRFFGKVLGTNGDYYVFETSIKEHEPEDPPPETPAGEIPPEPAGEGSNEYTYFVCSYLGGVFVRLPDVTPKAVVAARKIKKYFTGDLDAPVWSYPPFPGNEAMYLRAQIGRIASATVVCPAGYLVVHQEGDAEGPKKLVIPGSEGYEEVEPKYEEKEDLQEMREPVNWSHRYRYLKKQGRVETYEPPDDADPEAAPVDPPEPDVDPELLSTLDGDTESECVDWGSCVMEEIDGSAQKQPAWTSCTSSNVVGVKNQTVAIKSMVWPGAFAVYQPGPKFSNCYVGYGIKNAPYVPAPPPAVMTEAEEIPKESDALPPKAE